MHWIHQIHVPILIDLKEAGYDCDTSQIRVFGRHPAFLKVLRLGLPNRHVGTPVCSDVMHGRGHGITMRQHRLMPTRRGVSVDVLELTLER